MNEGDLRDLVEHRLGQARATLADARSLLDARGTPASIINRAYYAMFYAVLALLQTTGKSSSKHSGVIALFDREFVAKGEFPRSMSKSLHWAFDQRQTYDYKVLTPPPREEAQELYQEGERFIRSVEEYLARRAAPDTEQ